MNRKLVLATNNPGKVREFRRLLDGCGFNVVTSAELGIKLDVEETGTTYADNAALKAHAFADATGCLALADDSGIEVDALGGKPGMYSARYGGPGLDDVARTALLLKELDGVPDELRTARYRAIVAIAWPKGTNSPAAAGEHDSPLPRTAEGQGVRGGVLTFEGVQEGSIGHSPIGDGGFGYDPVFLVDGVRTQAQISSDEKDQISHRGQAVRAARAYLRTLPR